MTIVVHNHMRRRSRDADDDPKWDIRLQDAKGNQFHRTIQAKTEKEAIVKSREFGRFVGVVSRVYDEARGRARDALMYRGREIVKREGLTSTKYSVGNKLFGSIEEAQMYIDSTPRGGDARVDAGWTVYGLPDGSSVKVRKEADGSYYLDVSNRYDMRASSKGELDRKLKELKAKGPIGWEGPDR